MEPLTEEMLKNAEEEIIEQSTEPVVEESTEEQPMDIYGLLSQYSGAPTKEDVSAWKVKHKSIFCFGVSDEEVFIVRPIKRAEWNKIQFELQKMGQEYQQQVEQVRANLQPNEKFELPEPPQIDFVEEKVVRTCILWGTEDGFLALDEKAGMLNNLFELIMRESRFMEPQVASQLVIKL